MILDKPDDSELMQKANNRKKIIQVVLTFVSLLGSIAIGISAFFLIYGLNATGYDRLIAILVLLLGIASIVLLLPFLFLFAAFRAYRKCIDEEASTVYYKKGVNQTKNFFISIAILMSIFLFFLFVS